MQVTLVHTTAYRYVQPVTFNPHRLMLRPRGGADLQLLSHALEVSPEAELAWSQDVFGNLVTTANIRRPAAELVITSTLRLNLTAAPWPVFPLHPRAQTFPFDYAADEVIDLGAFRGVCAVDPLVHGWARAFVAPGPTDTLSLLKDLNAGVLASVTYRMRDEEGTQTSAETLRTRSGSCRDLAALFVDAARGLGFAARAASGYLFNADAPQQTANTTHAWAEVFLPGAGWVAFDPTHASVGGAGLITVAIGRCNAQILPITGSYVGAERDFVGMDVTVRVDLGAPPQPASSMGAAAHSPFEQAPEAR